LVTRTCRLKYSSAKQHIFKAQENEKYNRTINKYLNITNRVLRFWPVGVEVVEVFGVGGVGGIGLGVCGGFTKVLDS
jgi:hypothetical protein